MKTIKSNKDINFIFKNGEFKNLPFFKLLIINNNSKIAGTVAFITGKKLGNAVWRNSAKRRLKNFYYLLENNNFLNNKQVLLLAKQNILEKKYKEQEKIIIKKIKDEKIFN